MVHVDDGRESQEGVDNALALVLGVLLYRQRKARQIGGKHGLMVTFTDCSEAQLGP